MIQAILTEYRRALSELSIFLSGCILGLIFAPIFFIPGIFALSILCVAIHKSKNWAEAMIHGFWFGFGFYLTTLYWISIGIGVYIENFWWMIPIALILLPAFLSIFVSIFSATSWLFRNSNYYHFIFAFLWLIMEISVSYVFTGFPWCLVGYSLSFSDTLIQFASVTSIYGLSFICVYTGSTLYALIIKDYKILASTICSALIITTSIIIYGYIRLKKYPVENTSILVRIVQPSIEQKDKWSSGEFWDNLNSHIKLSKEPGSPDIIIWSEAALVAPSNIPIINDALKKIFTKEKQFLITGSVTENKIKDELKLYSSMEILDNNGDILDNYHKNHLVPFGEYIPLRGLIPFKKITHGVLDYSKGEKHILSIKSLGVKIKPLICYEAIFPFDVLVKKLENVDFMLHITNDSWYGNSSGPYEHFHISRIRALENGLPMIRVGNNGISGIIDPLGRVINKTSLNQVTFLDSYIPQSIEKQTYLRQFSYLTIVCLVCLVYLLQSTVYYFCAKKIFLVEKP